MLFWILKLIFFLPYTILFPTIIKGRKHIPKGKCVLIVNHRSNIDPIIVVNTIWRTQYTVAKKELFKNPLVGGVLKAFNGIPINRAKIELSSVKKCLGVLKKDKILTVFPEGTRNKTKEPLLEIKGGAAIFAIKANAPIVPVWIKKKPRLFMLNKIYVGEPFYITKDQTAQSDEILRDKLLELREQTLTKTKKTKK